MKNSCLVILFMIACSNYVQAQTFQIKIQINTLEEEDTLANYEVRIQGYHRTFKSNSLGLANCELSQEGFSGESKQIRIYLDGSMVHQQIERLIPNETYELLVFPSYDQLYEKYKFIRKELDEVKLRIQVTGKLTINKLDSVLNALNEDIKSKSLAVKHLEADLTAAEKDISNGKISEIEMEEEVNLIKRQRDSIAMRLSIIESEYEEVKKAKVNLEEKLNDSKIKSAHKEGIINKINLNLDKTKYELRSMKKQFDRFQVFHKIQTSDLIFQKFTQTRNQYEIEFYCRALISPEDPYRGALILETEHSLSYIKKRGQVDNKEINLSESSSDILDQNNEINFIYSREVFDNYLEDRVMKKGLVILSIRNSETKNIIYQGSFVKNSNGKISLKKLP